MARKRFRAEQIILKLREAEVGLGQVQTVGHLTWRVVPFVGEVTPRWAIAL